MSALFAAVLVPLALLQGAAPPVVLADAVFDPASAFLPPTAISYAPDLVPYGSQVRIAAAQAAGRTAVTLSVRGLTGSHEFPAHVHTGRCGADPASSGPHYQDRLDPVQPSTDPAYANDRNELRMVLRTDPHGDGTAQAVVAWSFRPGEARSIVLHAGQSTDGSAGALPSTGRVACVNVDF